MSADSTPPSGVDPETTPSPTAPAAPLDAPASALGRARAAAAAKGLRPGSKPPPRRTQILGTGAGFEQQRSRDPESLDNTLARLVATRGWSAPSSVGSVLGRWREGGGDQIADNANPETFSDGKLVVRTTSTAWATQLGLLLPQLQRRLDEEIGEGVVAEIVVIGPGAPSWKRGLRSVQGRGPRDTYG